MDKYAIVKIGPFQYTVEEGKSYTLPKFEAEEGKKKVIEDVLAIGNGDKVTIGKPLVEGASVTISVEEQAKGKKVKTSTFKAKSRYRKTSGHRQRVTKFTVEKIKAK